MLAKPHSRRNSVVKSNAGCMVLVLASIADENTLRIIEFATDGAG
jgi:hypothetical protein